MGKQLNYWMDYDNFVLLAQKALDMGFVIYRRRADENGKIVYGSNIDIITQDEKNYLFYLPTAGNISIKTGKFGEYVASGYNECGNSIIEAGYSFVNEKQTPPRITRNRIFCITGYFDENEQFIYRPDVLTKAYNSLARYVKKLAPYTELHDMITSKKEDTYGQLVEYIHKEYVTPWCLQKREEGYTFW